MAVFNLNEPVHGKTLIDVLETVASEHDLKTCVYRPTDQRKDSTVKGIWLQKGFEDISLRARIKRFFKNIQSSYVAIFDTNTEIDLLDFALFNGSPIWIYHDPTLEEGNHLYGEAYRCLEHYMMDVYTRLDGLQIKTLDPSA